MSAEERSLRVSVIAPDRVGYEGRARSVVAPAHDGELGILYGHAPMTVLLGEGELRVRSEGETERFRVARGGRASRSPLRLRCAERAGSPEPVSVCTGPAWNPVPSPAVDMDAAVGPNGSRAPDSR